MKLEIASIDRLGEHVYYLEHARDSLAPLRAGLKIYPKVIR